MKRIIVLLLMFTAGYAAAEGPAGVEFARKKAVDDALISFAGTWELVETEPEGVTKQARKIVFRRDLTYSALDNDDKEQWSGTFDLDPTKAPKIWDHRSHESRKKGGDALGIYELDGDTLTLCCVTGVWKGNEWMGKPRPTEFQRPAAEVVLKLRRANSDK